MKVRIIASFRFFLKTDYAKAALFYLGLICLVYSPIVFYGKTLSMAARYPWFSENPPEAESALPQNYPNIFNVDIASPAAFEEPTDVFVGNQLKRGVFPFWNPFISCGTVVQEQFSTRTLFPYQLLQNICPWAWRDLFLLGRLFLAALGVFIFLRLRGIGFYPALCGGAMYGLSGVMTVFLTSTQMSNVGMMLPFALIGSQLLLAKTNIYSTIFFSLAMAFLILGGQPEVAFYSLLFIFVYHIFRIINDTESRLKAKSYFVFLAAIAAALLISSPSFVPFLANSGQYYSLHPIGGNQGIGSTPPLNFVAVIIPELLRFRAPIFAFTFNYGWDRLGGYTGIICLFLAVASLKKRWWGRREHIFFLGFALFILLKNLGLPVISWIGRLPVFDQVWAPRWAGPVWSLAFILAAIFGFEALLAPEEKAEEPRPYQVTSRSPSLLIPIAIEAIILFAFIILNTKLSIVMDILSRGLNLPPILTWNLLLIILIVSGGGILFLLYNHAEEKPPNFLWRPVNLGSSVQVVGEVMILALGIFINMALWTVMTNGSNFIYDPLAESTGVLLRVFCIVMSCLITYYAARRFALTFGFCVLLAVITFCIFNFQIQAQEVRGDYFYWGHLFSIKDQSLRYSFWLAVIESILFSLFMMVDLFLLWTRRRQLGKDKLALILCALIIVETSFHVTIGLDETGRLFCLGLHLAALVYLMRNILSDETGTPKIYCGKTAAVFCTGMLLTGTMSFTCLPNRQNNFSVPHAEINPAIFSRSVGTRGAVFPNAACALGIQDVKGIVSLSIRRFQLFQDHCLRSWPNKWQYGLWLTGITDSNQGKIIFRNIHDRHYFYSLAGVENYLAFDYLNIPYTRLIGDGGLKTYYNEAAMPRAFVVSKWSVVDTADEALEWMLNKSFSFNMLNRSFVFNLEAVVEGSDIRDDFHLTGGDPAWAKIKSYDLHSVEIEAQTSSPGLLILTDTYHSDWSVTVDGKKQKIYPADLCFRGVFLEPGRHEVKFTYFPRVFYLCLAISCLTLLGMLFICCRRQWLKYSGFYYAKSRKK